MSVQQSDRHFSTLGRLEVNVRCRITEESERLDPKFLCMTMVTLQFLVIGFDREGVHSSASFFVLFIPHLLL